MTKDELLAAILIAVLKNTNGELYISNDLLNSREPDEFVQIEQTDSHVELKLKRNTVIEIVGTTGND
jgi:hypothetical protein